MLYVQFDSAASAASRLEPPPGAVVALRARRIGDVLEGLALRQTEPAILALRYLVAYAVGVDGLEAAAWTRRGLDIQRGFAIAVGARLPDGHWPIGLAARALDSQTLRIWLKSRRVAPRTTSASDSEVVVAGAEVADAALSALVAPWAATLASDQPYLELTARFGVAGPLGTLWVAASRRAERFQVEIVASLPGLPPLHVIARDPPTGGDQTLPPPHLAPVRLRGLHDDVVGAPVAARNSGAEPPSWDEPGPCDCDVPPDLCAMKAFRLNDPDAAPASLAAGAETFRQLSASIVDLHPVRASRARGIHAGDRVLVAERAECRAALGPDDVVLDRAGQARRFATVAVGEPIAGVVLQALPLSSLGQLLDPRRAFTGLW